MRVVPGLKAGASVSEALSLVARSFELAGVEAPKRDARALLGHALCLTRAQLLAQSNRLLEAREIVALSALSARRLKREPVSRILGFREFWNLNLQITPDVLDPRPDTETLVEAVLEFLTRGAYGHRPLKILDIGTGSGAVLLALLSDLPKATGVATDISAAAIAVARANAARSGLSERCKFVVCNIAAGLSGRFFDVIVSNPPYVRHEDIMMLAPEVRDYDPAIALDGGADGLCAYHAIAREAQPLLAAQGRLFVELGAGQELAVSQIFYNAGLAAASMRPDLAGIPRVLSAGL